MTVTINISLSGPAAIHAPKCHIAHLLNISRDSDILQTSLIKILNQTGSKTEPWGTPLVTLTPFPPCPPGNYKGTAPVV